MDTKSILVEKVSIQPITFTEEEISNFNKMWCRGSISISTDISNPTSPLWVNFIILHCFVKLYITYWDSTTIEDKKIIDQQKEVLTKMIIKITYVHNLAIRHSCINGIWVDLGKLLNSTKTNKNDNFKLAKFQHHEYDILEIEKAGLEQSKTELCCDILDEIHLHDIILFSKLMALKLHGMFIP
jgi:hypothetical protein